MLVFHSEMINLQNIKNYEQMKNFYHLFANGDEAGGFIVCESDYVYEFNLIGICAWITGAIVLSFSLEDSHPHILLYGKHEQIITFLRTFEQASLKHICVTRGSRDGVTLECELCLIEDESYLRNVAAYTIVQPTKDGRPVMHYDYRWGTGSMYFRPENHRSIWRMGKDGESLEAVPFGEMTAREKKSLAGRYGIPDDWLVCNGIILPENYVDVKLFEKIFLTHNCFRVFTASGRSQLSVVQDTMAKIRGIGIEDDVARKYCADLALEKFGTKDIHRMRADRRLDLARALQTKYGISYRQLHNLLKIKEDELRKYIK